MDLGIEGRYAVVCASSQGLGKACARALAEAGCIVVVNGRNEETLAATAKEIATATGAEVVPVVADVGTKEGRTKLLAAIPKVDILVNNNGGPPLRAFADLDHEGILAGLEGNLVAPVELAQAVLPAMVAQRFGRIVNITSVSVKQPQAGLDLSSGARAGLTAFLSGVAREVAHANVTINFLLPGRFATRRVDALFAHEASTRGGSPDEARKRTEAGIPARRLGDPAELGAACAFLCSASAGYITAQNLVVDGGTFPGVL